MIHQFEATNPVSQAVQHLFIHRTGAHGTVQGGQVVAFAIIALQSLEFVRTVRVLEDTLIEIVDTIYNGEEEMRQVRASASNDWVAYSSESSSDCISAMEARIGET